MTHQPFQPKPVYEKPTLEVLGSFARLTLWNIDPDKWTSAADWVSGGISGIVSGGGPGS